MTEKFRNQLTKECAELSIDLSDAQISKFYEYYLMIIEWNKFMNLTAVTEMQEVITKHFVDSLLIVKTGNYISDNALSVIDVGTGAGFPGIPLKIAFPNLCIILVDSLNKRISFLNHVIETLQLENITAIHSRAEDLGQDKRFREQFDLCVSRAVSNIATLSEYCLPFVKIGGKFISYKSGKIQEELDAGKRAIHTLGGKVIDTKYVTFSKENMERSFVVIEKKEFTKKKYPRRSGLPYKEPIN